MGQPVTFITQNHLKTKRDYLARGADPEKATKAEIASRFDFDYWDGDRQFGFGGYRYDGRWKSVAQKMVEHYQLKDNAKILDIGCAKGYLLYELSLLLPNATLKGIDISDYALLNAHAPIRDCLSKSCASTLPFESDSFDLVVSNMTLHNLTIDKLFAALREVERVSNQDSWICVESWNNMQEKINMLNWQLTCRAFFDINEWLWIFKEAGYTGDYEFGFFS